MAAQYMAVKHIAVKHMAVKYMAVIYMAVKYIAVKHAHSVRCSEGVSEFIEAQQTPSSIRDCRGGR